MISSLRLTLALSALTILIALSGCVGMYPDRLIARQDHAGLALYHDQEARELKHKANEWETLAGLYEKHPDLKANVETIQFATRCRTIAQHFRKATEEAEALAALHRQALSRGGTKPLSPE